MFAYPFPEQVAMRLEGVATPVPDPVSRPVGAMTTGLLTHRLPA